MSAPIWAVVTGVVVSATVTYGVLHISRRYRWVDAPNERSAHQEPTPTLGGIGILGALLAGLWVAPGAESVRWPISVCLAVLALASIDDLGRPLSVAWKLLLQASVVVLWLAISPVAPLTITADVTLSGVPAIIGSGLFLLWLMNVSNFMDGIDGFTASQTAVMCLTWVILGAPAAVLPTVLVAACAGFLLFNAPPARIFMGDVGSLTLGFGAGLTVLSLASSGVDIWIAAIPLAGYALDTGQTILWRLFRGENILQAHDQHLYQRLTQAGWSHTRVDLAAAAVTALYGIAAIAMHKGVLALASMCVAVPTLVLLAGIAWKERRYGG